MNNKLCVRYITNRILYIITCHDLPYVFTLGEQHIYIRRLNDKSSHYSYTITERQSFQSSKRTTHFSESHVVGHLDEVSDFVLGDPVVVDPPRALSQALIDAVLPDTRW